MKKLRTLALAALMAVSSIGISTVPAAATVPWTGNLAGRPMDGSAGQPWSGGNDCHGIAYGRVNGALVLFTAHHCQDSSDNPNYPKFYAPDGGFLGTLYTGSAGAAADLGYVVLAAGAHPSVLNKVYSNNGSGGYTITMQPNLTCSGAIGGDASYQAFQTYYNSTYGPNVGISQGATYAYQGGACRMLTNIPSHATAYKDSGTPLILASRPNTVSGVGSGRTPGNALFFGSVRDGLADISAKVGPAYLCTTASC